MKHELKTVKISSLKEFEGNPNVHNKVQVEALAASMKKYGQYYPIIVDENLLILAGHGKKLALEKLGKKTAQVNVIHGLDEKQKKKLLLEDNKIQGMSFIDFDLVEKMLLDINDHDVIGFSDEYLDALLSEPTMDNMGVDYTQEAESRDESSQETTEDQQDDINQLKDGVKTIKSITCPHCGEKINF